MAVSKRASISDSSSSLVFSLSSSFCTVSPLSIAPVRMSLRVSSWLLFIFRLFSHCQPGKEFGHGCCQVREIIHAVVTVIPKNKLRLEFWFFGIDHIAQFVPQNAIVFYARLSAELSDSERPALCKSNAQCV